ncbi:MAG: aminotransferase class V-fold PLP-dependent enzyme [Vicinamibacterales bacterium]
MNRRNFARLLAGSSAAVLLDRTTTLKGRAAGLETGFARKFPLEPGLTFMNAANLCPSSLPVIESLQRWTTALDRDPSQATKTKLAQAKEETRAALARMLRVTPEEIVITRNTSEANNLVSSGLGLKAGDEVVIFADNHPSNHAAWREKGTRAGLVVHVVPAPSPHPGPDYFVEAFLKKTTAKTRVWAFTHVTNTVGDLLPVKDLCRTARGRGILTLVDGAQTFGVLDVDLSDLTADFYTGSAHKWPCGPREVGLLYAAKQAPALAPSVISLYAGAVGASRTLEAYGQRDEPAVAAFGAAVGLRGEIGGAAIERHAHELAQALVEGLRTIDGVKIWTDATPSRSAAVVSFQPAGLNPRALAAALYEKECIAIATRAGNDRPGLRVSPHIYNTHADVEKVVAAVARYVRAGI